MIQGDEAPPAAGPVGEDLPLPGAGRGWAPICSLTTPGSGLPQTHLQPAEPGHAVHHLGDAEAVTEVVERVVTVVVVHAELRRREGPPCGQLPTPPPSSWHLLPGANCLLPTWPSSNCPPVSRG